MQVLVRRGSRLGFSAFEVKVLDEHILFVDRYTTKMAFRGFCIGTLLLIYIYITRTPTHTHTVYTHIMTVVVSTEEISSHALI